MDIFKRLIHNQTNDCEPSYQLYRRVIIKMICLHYNFINMTFK